jgi:hypothetical protein
VERVQDQFLLSPAPFCGASGARSSICACLACNTPAASRATYAVTSVPILTVHLPLEEPGVTTSVLWKPRTWAGCSARTNRRFHASDFYSPTPVQCSYADPARNPGPEIY